MGIKLLITSGTLPEKAVEVEYLREEEIQTYYNEVPRYTCKYGDYYERTVEKIPANSWEGWLQYGEQHERIEVGDDIIYRRYHREQGHLVIFETVEELFKYLASQGGIEIYPFKLLDGTPIYGVADYYD